MPFDYSQESVRQAFMLLRAHLEPMNVDIFLPFVLSLSKCELILQHE